MARRKAQLLTKMAVRTIDRNALGVMWSGIAKELGMDKNVGSLAGMGGTSAVFGVLITTWLVPTLTQNGYVPFCALATALVPLGVAMIFMLSGEIKRIG